MNIWYCVECGDYHFFEPKTKKDERGRLQQCSLCKTMSIIPVHELSKIFPLEVDDKTLKSFANSTKKEFPGMIFDDDRPVYRPLNYLTLSPAPLASLQTQSGSGFP